MGKLKLVDAYVLKHEKWSQALDLLRESILLVGMEECYKWSAPVYAFKKKNVVGLGAFKNHFGVWFFNGVLLKDVSEKLHNAQEGKTTAMRQWRFHSLEEVVENLEEIEMYLRESMANVEVGNVMMPRIKKVLIIPQELEDEFQKVTGLKSAFDELNLTKKREFVAHLDSAKREKTKIDRLNKIVPMIWEGKGLNDKYRK